MEPLHRSGLPPVPPKASPPPPPPAFQIPAVRPVNRQSAHNPSANTPGVVPPRVPVSGVGAATRGIYWRGELAVEAENIHGEPTDETTDQISVEKAAPPWLISLVIHLILLLVLALIVSPAGQRLSTVVLEMGNSQDKGDDLESFEMSQSDPTLDSALELEPAVAPEMVVEMPKELFSVDSLIQSLEPVQAEVLSVNIPVGGMMSGRSGSSKEALLAAYGGTGQTEDAVQLGLRWLAAQQNSSEGYWSLRGPYEDGALSENRIAATSMALLAFQGNGNTHLSGPYKDEVNRGLRWLIKQQDKTGYFCKNIPRHERMYAQAQASIAICELYAMTNDSWLREYAQRALNFATDSQSNLGGWRYDPREDSDTSVTGWFVMAIQSGRSAGLEVNDDVFRKVGYFLDSVQYADGAAYAYQPGNGPSPAMTAEGMLCRQYLGWKREDPIMASCVNALVDQKNFQYSDLDSYYWYYATQVLHHYGGSPWRMWNERMRVQLPDAQEKNGSEAGSWSPQGDRWGGQSGRLYMTCMALYCLEVYYRHMPLYDLE